MATSSHPQEIVLVRHGETEWSASLRHTGRTDIPLTEEGRRQATALATCLRPWTFAAVLSSPLSRAVETARLARFDNSLETTEDLLEWDYGAYEGRTTAEIRQDRPGWSLWKDGVIDGEAVEQLGDRADRVVERVRRIEGDVALFAHGHILRVVAARWLGLPPDRGRSFGLDTATLSVLGYEREEPVIRRWNQPCAG